GIEKNLNTDFPYYPKYWNLVGCRLGFRAKAHCRQSSSSSPFGRTRNSMLSLRSEKRPSMPRNNALRHITRQAWTLAAVLGAACNTPPGGFEVNQTPPSHPSDGGGPEGATHCKPKCGVTCGVDDGCGAKCGCGAGLECQKGVCVDPACGPCRPNEHCVDKKGQCVPNCQGRDCQADGCGAACPCPTYTGVSAQGTTVPLDQCKDSCSGAGWKCGALCGRDCGSCPSGQTCKSGACVCAPKCDGTSCADGCGGTCACADETVCNV